MSQLTDSGLPAHPLDLYDPFVDSRREDVYATYADLRRDFPVYYNQAHQVWCLSRFADVRTAARDWKTFSSLPGTDLDAPNLYGIGNFLDDDPPSHDALRAVAQPLFSPKAMLRLADEIRRRVDELLDELRDKGTVDLAKDFAIRLPTWVISRLLGVPETDDELVYQYVHEVESHESGDTEPSSRAVAAVAHLRTYLYGLANDKLRHPDDKIMSHLARLRASGEITQEQLGGIAGILFGAGTETTFTLLGTILNLLTEHPNAQRQLRADESGKLADAAIEEVLRFDGPVQYTARTTTQSVSIHGHMIPEGSRVALLFAAANRDAARWERPDEFDIGRKRMRHLGFGDGIHACLGAPLARLEAQIAVPAFLRAFSSYHIEERTRRDNHLVRGWAQLQATLVPTSRVGGNFGEHGGKRLFP